jgi:hypothetical protein
VLIALKAGSASDKLLFELPSDFVLSLVDRFCKQALALIDVSMSEMAIFHQLDCCSRSRPSAEQQNSKRACQDLQREKAKDARVKPGSPATRCHHENVV